MKKYVLIIALLLISVSNYAQYEKVIFSFIGFKWEDAKTEIDKLVNDSKTAAAAETWLWKTRVYSEIFLDSTLSRKYPTAGDMAFEAFKKYQSLDMDYQQIADPSVGWRSWEILYVTFFSMGRKAFLDKRWDDAYKYFEKSAYLGEVSVKKDLHKNGSKIDTVTTLYAGYAAQNALKTTEALKYYSKAADFNILSQTDTAIYQYLLFNYSEKKDKANFQKYFALAKSTFPKQDWGDYELDFLNKNTSLADKALLYDKDDAAGTLTAEKYLYFAGLFYNLSKDDKAALNNDSTKISMYHTKAREAFKKAFNKDKTDGISAYNVGAIYYTDFFNIYDERIRENIKQMQLLNTTKLTEKDPKKKASMAAKVEDLKKQNSDLDALTSASADDCIVWLENSINVLKDKKDRVGKEKSCLKNAINMVSNVFAYKRDKAKGKDPKAFDMYEAKYKFYDDLYSKY